MTDSREQFRPQINQLIYWLVQNGFEQVQRRHFAYSREGTAFIHKDGRLRVVFKPRVIRLDGYAPQTVKKFWINGREITTDPWLRVGGGSYRILKFTRDGVPHGIGFHTVPYLIQIAYPKGVHNER